MFNVTLINKDSHKSKALKTLKGAYKSIYNFLKEHRQDRQTHAILTGAGITRESYSDYETVPYTPKLKKDFLLSSTWSELRLQALERDEHRCQICGKTPKGDKVSLDVHHIIERAIRPDLKAEISNLQTLCKQCHQALTNRFNKQG